MSLIEHLQRNPTSEKGQGRPWPTQGTPLTDLTTVKLNRKDVRNLQAERVERMLCNVHPELHISPPPSSALTQPTNNAHDLYHFTKLCVLCWFEVEQSGMVLCKANVICWSGVAVVVWSDGLILVGRSGQTMVWCGSWCIVWSVVTSETTPIVWCGGLIWDGSGGLLLWSGSMA